MTAPPRPDADALAHSEALAARIRAEIAAAGGALPFERFMHLALYAPGLGYYAAGAAKLGPAGDFVTAPEISPAFGASLATPVGEALAGLARGAVLELGAGTGRLVVDLLAALESRGQAPREYLVLEPSPELRARQRAFVEAAGPATPVRWLDDLPADFTGVVIANEVLDALPVHRFRLTDDGVAGEAVITHGDGFARVPGRLPSEAEAAVAALLDEIGPLPSGYASELSLAGPALLARLGKCLAAGAVLLADYGYPRREYYHRERTDGTLRAHYRHRRHDDPCRWPGLQDVTAHVDFTALARAAVDSGLEVRGFAPQSAFLLAAGILDGLDGLDPASPAFMRLTAEIKRLTLPAEMGDVVSVMALTRDLPVRLSGFAPVDHRHRL